MIESRDLFRLTPTGVDLVVSAREIDRAAAEFSRQQCILVRRALSGGLCDDLRRTLPHTGFHSLVHEDIGARELCADGGRATSLLEVAVNRRDLFDLVGRISGQTERVGLFDGRIYRLVPGEGHDAWHDDVGDSRQVAMSINLSEEVYTGGVLQIRDKATGRIVAEAHNIGYGDALLFRVDRRLAHRVADVTGTVPKTAWAGWFRSGVTYESTLLDRARRLMAIRP